MLYHHLMFRSPITERVRLESDRISCQISLKWNLMKPFDWLQNYCIAEITQKRLKNKKSFISLKHAVGSYQERVQFVKDSSRSCMVGEKLRSFARRLLKTHAEVSISLIWPWTLSLWFFKNLEHVDLPNNGQSDWIWYQKWFWLVLNQANHVKDPSCKIRN